jgi:hypothetical protein
VGAWSGEGASALGRARRVYQTNRPRGTTAAGHGWGGRCRVAVTGAARAVPHVVRKFARGGGPPTVLDRMRGRGGLDA